MSIVTTHDVFCDGPRRSEPCPDNAWCESASTVEGAREARRQASTYGWRRRRHGDVCPACVARSSDSVSKEPS